ncbi:MAG: DUF305 domain-containing protein [Longimicrobiales bacterium]|jgi:uncharacterized protein (DUF305 family)|nr:DUF305 domain-containing protein [Longimicrobiales bacterium]
MMTIDIRSLSTFALAAVLAACSGNAPSPASAPAPAGDGPRIVQPGAPGQSGRTFSADELAQVEGVSYTDADVRFMQGMIPHHRQALDMTALVRQNAGSEAVRQMALRMEISQRDEIAMISSWLRERGESIEMPGMGAMQHSMMRMLTPEQMRELSNSRGTEFDRLFLEGMIQHHLGALDMVTQLFNTSGAAQESTVFKFAEDVDADQLMEIERMQAILDQLGR